MKATEQLDAWLSRIGAACISKHWVGPAVKGRARGSLEKYRVRSGVFIVERDDVSGHFDIYTACETTNIDLTLAHAEQRLGLNRKGA